MLINYSCNKTSGASITTATGSIPDMYKKFNSTVQISVVGNYVILKTNGLPDHKSPYFNTSDSRYEAYNGTNTHFMQNPNKIIEQSLTFKVPISPMESSNKQTTPLGPIGIALNGVPIYNQYAGPATPLTNEINSFDQYNGHPQQSGQYHYHVEPLYLTSIKGKTSLIGVLLDGFPVYGPSENGNTITDNDLDSYHGHFSVTADYPNGIYHYHITAEAPYINGNGFNGTPGSVTQ